MSGLNSKYDLNFKALFEALPGLFLILIPDPPIFTIAAASDEYLKATKTKREEIEGRPLFEVFPDNPNDVTAEGVNNIRKSLEYVLEKKMPNAMPALKYDIPIPGSEGQFEERYWVPVNSPVFGTDNKIQYIINKVEDVTEMTRKINSGNQLAHTALEELEKKALHIKENEKRINKILDILLRYTRMDFSRQIEMSASSDELDAIAAGLNTLGEELQNYISKLKESEERYYNMVEEVGDYAILLLDKEGNIQNWNKGAENIKGYKSKEIIGKNFGVFYPESERRKGLPEKQLATAIKKGKAISEGWRIRKDGTSFWAYVVLTALHDANNNIIGFSKVTRDMTLIKEAEDRLVSVNKELEAFSYSVSHDLRAPLRAVSGYAEMLNEDYGSKLDKDGKRIIETIKQNAQKMGTLIDDLLTFSRLGRKDIQKTDIDMNELTEGVLIEINKVITHKAKIVVSKLPSIKADYGLLHQVFFNLISNAIKYSSKKEAPLIEIFSEEKTNEVIFTVKDNGAGFDMKYANKLFGVFQRLHSQEEFEGIGVGLAIVQRIITKHGGKVWAEGKVDKGATFNFSLNKV